MDAQHKDFLRKNRVALVESIQNVHEVVDYFVRGNILNVYMKSDLLERESSVFNRVRALLDLLPRRGPQAYSLFCKALEECGETDALKLLGLEESPDPTDKQLAELQDPRCNIHLGEDVYVSAKTWKGEVKIHIRKYEVYPSGKSYPTRRGIVLTLKHWMELSNVFYQIDEAVTQGNVDTYVHFGANMYGSQHQNGGVDLRQWEWNDRMGNVVPTAKGILLSPKQWNKLRDCVQMMPDFVPELKDMVPCAAGTDHMNQTGYLQCSFCNPNGHDICNQWLFFYGWKSQFSNFHRSVFTLNGITFNCVEQCYMYSKAMYFGDLDSATCILQETVPVKQKRLGRCVKGFTQKVWDTVSVHIMTKALMAKFSQNNDLKHLLIQSYPKQLVEASPFDKRWGIGINVSHPYIDKPWKWPGENLMGKTLMYVREILLM